MAAPKNGRFDNSADGLEDRRRAKRERIDASLSLFSVDPSRAALVTDISTSGCRLRGELLPAIGRDVWLKAGDLHLFGRVVWSSDVERGIEFERPIGKAQLQKLRDFRKHQLGQDVARETP